MDPATRKVRNTVDLSEADKAAMASLLHDEVEFSAGKDIAAQGSSPNFATVLLEGLSCRYLSSRQGGRQISALGVPGDWIDLMSYFVERMDHSVAAITDCRVARIGHRRLKEVLEAHPVLAYALWRDATLESCITLQWVVNVGGRDAISRAAHLFCELDCRFARVGLSREHSFSLPMNQATLGEALGISSVHANRVLQALRKDGLISFEGRVLTIRDWDALSKLGDFDPEYLHLEDRPPPSSGQPAA